MGQLMPLEEQHRGRWATGSGIQGGTWPKLCCARGPSYLEIAPVCLTYSSFVEVKQAYLKMFLKKTDLCCCCSGSCVCGCNEWMLFTRGFRGKLLCGWVCRNVKVFPQPLESATGLIAPTKCADTLISPQVLLWQSVLPSPEKMPEKSHSGNFLLPPRCRITPLFTQVGAEEGQHQGPAPLDVFPRAPLNTSCCQGHLRELDSRLQVPGSLLSALLLFLGS